MSLASPIPRCVNMSALEGCTERGCDTPSDRRSHQDLVNASYLPLNAKDSIVEGKDTAFDTHDDKWIEDLSYIDGLRRGF